MNAQNVRQVQQQIIAMGCASFEVGAIKQADANARQLLETHEAEWFMDVKNLARLASYNMKGYHIYVRPFGDHNLSLVDDLSEESVQKMKTDGFEPAVVVETSPGNFQAWVKHSENFRAGKLQESTLAAKMLAEVYGGDDQAAKGRGFGRLAGFTNQKEKYARESGGRKLFPFSRLIESNGNTCSRAEEFAKEVHARFSQRLDNDQKAAQKWRQNHSQKQVAFARVDRTQSLQDFYSRPEYLAFNKDGNTQYHRADFAYALYALDRLNKSRADVMADIDRGTLASSAGEPGSKKRAEYLERTVDTASARAGAWRQHRRTAKQIER